MTFSHTEPIDLTITETKRPTRPQFQFKNPLRDDIFVNGIDLISTPEFSAKGSLIIRVNRETVFDSSLKSIQGYAKYPISLNKEFLRDRTIEIFAWNSKDTNTLKFSGNISISDEPSLFQSQAEPLGKDLLNTVLSDNESLFQTRNYSDETVTQIIDMSGFRKIILIIASDKTLLPTVESFIGYADTENTVDADLTTKTPNESLDLDDYTTHEIIADFGRVASRKIRAQAESYHGGSSTSIVFTKLEISDNPIGPWTQVDETSQSGTGGTTKTHELDGGTQTFRYARVAQKKTTSFGGIGAINEIFDGDALGGQADISFEVLNRPLNRFIEYISSASIGAQSFGVDKTIIIGDVINDVSGNKFNFALPSSQTDFQARMTVTGNINVGVSVIKVQ